MRNEQMTAVSLFTSGGIGDLAIREAGFEILVSNELLDDRHAVFEFNFPNAKAITGDILQNSDLILRETLNRLGGKRLTLLYATPPCQGMSKNGRGKLLSAIRAGRKPPLDPRNRLIIPTMTLAKQLKPEVVLLENVPEMADTLIVDATGSAIQILDFVRLELGDEYHGCAEVVEFADYGVPQCRQRLITVFTRSQEMRNWFSECGTFMPTRTHSRLGIDDTKKWVSVWDAIADMPPLDAGTRDRATSHIPYHRVPLLDPMKYWWVSNTARERSAFDNQCVQCGFTGNPVHFARRDQQGINRTSKTTPLYCKKCGAMLPRPSVECNGQRVLMKGYTSAYKRMSYDKPASALTRNLSYACSDNKLHPEQNRVLSLHEAFRIHTLDQFLYHWKRKDGGRVSDKTIREIIGESIPPAGFKVILDYLCKIYTGKAPKFAALGPLFASHGTGM